MGVKVERSAIISELVIKNKSFQQEINPNTAQQAMQENLKHIFNQANPIWLSTGDRKCEMNLLIQFSFKAVLQQVYQI